MSTSEPLPRILTEHFTWNEVTRTSYPFSNIPPSSLWPAIKHTAEKMEQVRALLGGHAVSVSSWYRSKDVNTSAGGSPTSEHAIGRAVDFTCDEYGTPRDIVNLLSTHSAELGYNQLILELKGKTWVHISFPLLGVLPKNEVLTYTRTPTQGWKYLKGIV